MPGFTRSYPAREWVLSNKKIATLMVASGHIATQADAVL